MMQSFATLLMQGDSAGLTTSGTIIMLGSIGIVCSLVVFCLLKILRESKPQEHLHAPLEIDTYDQDPT